MSLHRLPACLHGARLLPQLPACSPGARASLVLPAASASVYELAPAVSLCLPAAFTPTRAAACLAPWCNVFLSRLLLQYRSVRPHHPQLPALIGKRARAHPGARPGGGARTRRKIRGRRRGGGSGGGGSTGGGRSSGSGSGAAAAAALAGAPCGAWRQPCGGGGGGGAARRGCQVVVCTRRQAGLKRQRRRHVLPADVATHAPQQSLPFLLFPPASSPLLFGFRNQLQFQHCKEINIK